MKSVDIPRRSRGLTAALSANRVARGALRGALALAFLVILIFAWEPANTNVALHPSGGFARNGEFASADVAVARTSRYGSWTGSDAHEGSLASDPFRASASIEFLVDGYPSHAGEDIYLERLEDGARLRLAFSRDPAERWTAVAYRLPFSWIGKTVRFHAVDRAADFKGWIGIADVRDGSFLSSMILGPLEGWAILGWLVFSGVIGLAAYSAIVGLRGARWLVTDVAAGRSAAHPRWWALLLKIGLLAVLIIGRRPESLLAPQLWAEDGPVYLAQGFIDGPVRAIFEPYAGYLQLFPRIVTIVARIAPVVLVPFVCAASSIAVAIWALAMFAGTRYRSVVRPDMLRFAICCAFASVIPMSEVFGNMTNAHWYLSLAVMLLLAAGPVSAHKTTAAGVRDSLLVFVGVLSGAETVVLTPFAIWRATRKRGAERWVSLTFLAAVVIQIIVLSKNVTVKGNSGPFVVAAGTFNAYVYRVVVSAFAGTGFTDMIALGSFHIVMSFALMSFACLTVVAIGIFARRHRVRYVLYLLVGLAWIAAALGGRGLADLFRSPGVLLLGADAGGRYFVLPMAAFLLAVGVALDGVPRLGERAKTLAFCALFVTGGVLNYRLDTIPDVAWSRYADAVGAWERAKDLGSSDAALSVPINPPGWSLQLPALPK